MSWPSVCNRSRLGTTKLVVPMTIRRRGLVTRPPVLRKLPEDHVAAQGGEVIHEEDAVEMVDLVLQAAGEKPVGLDLVLHALAIEIAHTDGYRAGDFRELAGQA